MRYTLLIITLILSLAIPVSAQNTSAPVVPEHAEKFMPDDQENFAEGLLEVLQDALLHMRPDLKEASTACLSIMVVMLLTSVLRSLPGVSEKTISLAGNTGISLILFRSSGSLIQLASTTVTEISTYGRLLLPVMTAAMAGQGNISTSSALYVGTAFFDALLTSLIGKLLIPMVYLYLVISVAYSTIGEETLKRLRDTIKWATVWTLKTILYIFTGYIGITGVISGATDAASLKAAKLAISGMVPVVGNILSDASEAVLISAATVKNAAGVYGLFAILAIWIGPFFRIGSHYLLLKAASALCPAFTGKSSTDLVQDFCSALGLLLAMTGAISLMLLISLVCFMKGVL